MLAANLEFDEVDALAIVAGVISPPPSAKPWHGVVYFFVLALA
jgi:hypothetical protein